MSRRIAFVGGDSYEPIAIDKFLWNLQEKYPRATIVVGSGSRSERHVAEAARSLRFNVETPAVHPEWFQGDTAAALRWQINDVLLDAPIIVIVGSGGRPELATEWWHRFNMHERDNRGGLVKRNGQYVSHRTTPIQLHCIAKKQKAQKQAA